VELCETGFGVLNDSLDAIFMSIVPSALSMMQSRGYDKVFRDKKPRIRPSSARPSHDTDQEVKKGRARRQMPPRWSYLCGLTGGGYMAAEEIAKQAALALLGQTRVGFLVDIGGGHSQCNRDAEDDGPIPTELDHI
jgi:hypothetical protein